MKTNIKYFASFVICLTLLVSIFIPRADVEAAGRIAAAVRRAVANRPAVANFVANHPAIAQVVANHTTPSPATATAPAPAPQNTAPVAQSSRGFSLYYSQNYTFNVAGVDISVALQLWCNDNCNDHRRNSENIARSYASVANASAGQPIRPPQDCSNSYYLLNVSTNGGGGPVVPPEPPVLTATCTVTPAQASRGQTVTWRANPVGGTGVYAYQWQGDASGTSRTFTTTYNDTNLPAQKDAAVRVVSGTQSVVSPQCTSSIVGGGGGGSHGVRIVATTTPLTTYLNAICYPNQSTIVKGNSITWTAQASYGTGTYSYRWSGDGITGAPTGTTTTVTYNSAGWKDAVVTVSDTGGNTLPYVGCAPSVNVTNVAPSNLACSIKRDGSDLNNNKVAVNSKTVWKVKDASGNDISSSYIRSWTVTEGSGPSVAAGSATSLEKYFSVTGLKTVSVSLSSSTNPEFTWNCDAGSTATTSVVLPGDLNEI